MINKYKLNSYLFIHNAQYIEMLYEQYMENSKLVTEDWRKYFDSLQDINMSISNEIIENDQCNLLDFKFENNKKLQTNHKEVNIDYIINAYRSNGFRLSSLDPLNLREQDELIPEININLINDDLDKDYILENTYFGFKKASLRDIINALKKTYCNKIGAEFMHIDDIHQKIWWQKNLESLYFNLNINSDKKRLILKNLIAAEGLEQYLNTRYIGQKRFSLEGGESLIVSMLEILNSSGLCGIKEIVIGMAHRGRLNVLVNVLGKMPSEIFAEFDGITCDNLSSGDVKYHKGFSSDIMTDGGLIHVSLAFNPSHLEIINSVIEGSAKARMDRIGENSNKKVLAVQVHGDSAFSGQGVIMEILNFSQTRGYSTFGTLHVIINNQIGFTTSDPRDTRSTSHCSDVIKMINAPILHVNGDDPEAVMFATKMAIDFRMQFHKDVIIDIVCFRKHGHNEQDTPSLTQPLMYKKISLHKGVREIYASSLIKEGIISKEDENKYKDLYYESLNKGELLDNSIYLKNKKNLIQWKKFLNKNCNNDANTEISISKLQDFAKSITTIPNKFILHPLVKKVINDRRIMGTGDIPIDWGMAEHLSFASLLSLGYSIRLSGQDSGRGTFTHRHAVLHDQNRLNWYNGTYIPLNNISKNQGKFTVIDSPLSEEGVLGFEYGYSTTNPNTLVIWEAQFGDFANGAQVVIDQFISSGEVKWGRLSGLTMLLPHGYEGQGPEHSSSRIERYLQLCAENNMQVVQPTTPAQIFHLLRRQIISLFRKPLIIFTPKSLLRHKEAVSSLSELSNKKFQCIIGEINKSIDEKNVKRILICSGRLYYDLIEYRRLNKIYEIAIIRIEQLYPLLEDSLNLEIKKYINIKEIFWVQDEPKNQGAWIYIKDFLRDCISTKQKVFYSGRAASASPAVGNYIKHCNQQKELIKFAFNGFDN